MTMAPAADRLARHALRLDVEEFLYAEAALLDAWHLDEWLALFTGDARYEVPSTDRPSGEPATALMLISDTHAMIRFAATGSFSASMPMIETEPASGRSSPATMRSVVVLPAPFGPSSA